MYSFSTKVPTSSKLDNYKPRWLIMIVYIIKIEW